MKGRKRVSFVVKSRLGNSEHFSRDTHPRASLSTVFHRLPDQATHKFPPHLTTNSARISRVSITKLSFSRLGEKEKKLSFVENYPYVQRDLEARQEIILKSGSAEFPYFA